jgi:hypothetical protein
MALEVAYPGRHVDSLPGGMKPFVLLEVGQARVVPFVERALSSWVHDHLMATKQAGSFTDNRPIAVRCVHPWVTCLEKLDAIARRFDAGKAAADFVRHYEDAARIIDRRDALPDVDVREITRLLRDEDGTVMPLADHAACDDDHSGERARPPQPAARGEHTRRDERRLAGKRDAPGLEHHDQEEGDQPVVVD